MLLLLPGSGMGVFRIEPEVWGAPGGLARAACGAVPCAPGCHDTGSGVSGVLLRSPEAPVGDGRGRPASRGLPEFAQDRRQ